MPYAERWRLEQSQRWQQVVQRLYDRPTWWLATNGDGEMVALSVWI